MKQLVANVLAVLKPHSSMTRSKPKVTSGPCPQLRGQQQLLWPFAISWHQETSEVTYKRQPKGIQWASNFRQRTRDNSFAPVVTEGQLYRTIEQAYGVLSVSADAHLGVFCWCDSFRAEARLGVVVDVCIPACDKRKLAFLIRVTKLQANDDT